MSHGRIPLHTLQTWQFQRRQRNKVPKAVLIWPTVVVPDDFDRKLKSARHATWWLSQNLPFAIRGVVYVTKSGEPVWVDERA